jgi:hypothetical protein
VRELTSLKLLLALINLKSTWTMTPPTTPHETDDLDDSVLLWSDDPEKAYFEYMLQQEQEQRAQRGQSAEDSLIGDSTIGEILEAGPFGDSPWRPSADDNDTKTGTMEGFSLAASSQKELLAPHTPWRQLDDNPVSIVEFSTSTPSKGKKQDKSKRASSSQEAPGYYSTQHPTVIYVAEKSPSTPRTITSKDDWLENSDYKIGPPADKLPVRRRLLFIVAVLSIIVIAGLVIVFCLNQIFEDQNAVATNVGAQQASPFGEEDPFFRHEALTASVTEYAPTAAPTQSAQATTMEEFTGVPSIIGTNSPAGVLDDTSVNDTLPASNCGCQACTPEVLSAQIAVSFTCHDRIQVLISTYGFTEHKACSQVTGKEFPELCSALLCHPALCLPSKSTGRDHGLAPITAILAPSQRPSNALKATTTPLRSTLRPTLQPTSSPPTPQPTTSPPSTPQPSLRPTTASPTPHPTHRPSTLSLTMRASNGLPLSVFPLGRCEGDCDTDEDCADGLICYHRGTRDLVPGCLDGDKAASVSDFCVPFDATLPPTTARPSSQPSPRPSPRPTTSAKPTFPRSSFAPTPLPRNTATDSLMWDTIWLNDEPTGISLTDEPTWISTWAPTWSPTMRPTDPEEDLSLAALPCRFVGLFCP